MPFFIHHRVSAMGLLLISPICRTIWHPIIPDPVAEPHKYNPTLILTVVWADLSYVLLQSGFNATKLHEHITEYAAANGD